MKMTICTPLLPGNRLVPFYLFLPAFLFSALAQYKGRQQLQAVFLKRNAKIAAFDIRKHIPFHRSTMTARSVRLILPARALLLNVIHLQNNIHTHLLAGATLLLSAGLKVCLRKPFFCSPAQRHCFVNKKMRNPFLFFEK